MMVKKYLLNIIGRLGYTLLKSPHWALTVEDSAQAHAEIERLRAETLQLARALAENETARIEQEHQLQEARRELRLAQRRFAEEVEHARGESWELRSKLVELESVRDELERVKTEASEYRIKTEASEHGIKTEAQEYHDRLALALDENRRLQIRVNEMPEIDYQVLMRQQAENARFLDADSGFATLYERVRHYSMTSIERLYAMYKATEYVSRAGIPGDIVECGVWRGGSMMMAALTLLLSGDKARRLILFDTFEGLPKPNASEDVDLWGHSAYNEWTRHRRTDTSSDLACASIEEVQQNMLSTGYPAENIVFVKGMVQETLTKSINLPDSVALLRLDTDWYESTAFELAHLYPRLSTNGVLVVDDYGHFKGQRKAIDEYLAKTNQNLLLMRVDYSGRVAIKTNGSRP